MTAEISKGLLLSILFIIIILSIIFYRLKKFAKYQPYCYLIASVSILCTFASLCFDTNLFKAEHDMNFYLIELIIYLSIIIISILIMFLIRKFKLKK